MTLPFVMPKITYVGDGTANPLPVKNGATPIRFRSNSHIKVEKRASSGTGPRVALVEGVDYSLTGGPDLGFVTPLAVIPVGTWWSIWREQPFDQDVDFGIASDYSSTRSTAVADKDREIQQELYFKLSNAVTWGPWGPPATAINCLLGLDGSGVLYPVTDIGAYIDTALGSNAWRSGGGGGSISDGDKGDVTVSGSGTVWTIDPAAVTLGKMANLAANSIIGNNTGSPATPIALTAAQVKTLLAIAISDVASLQASLDAKLALAGGTMLGAITLAADPAAALQPASKQYVDNLVAGLKPKGTVRFRTTANVNLAGGGLANGTSHDGITAATGDVVLVAAQTAPAENGLYIVPASGAASRATNMDSWAEVPGATVIVEVGTLYADTGWLCTADQGGSLGTTAISWSQWFGTGLYQAANALLTAISGLSPITADKFIYGTGSNTVALGTITTYGRSLVDDVDAATARGTLGLAAIAASASAADITAGTLAIARGGTGQGTAAAAFDALFGTAEAQIASAATTDIGAATTQKIEITGTVTITAFGTVAAGVMRWVRFSGALTVTHNATSLISPTGASITTAAGDFMLVMSLGSGNWRILVHKAAAGGGGGTPGGSNTQVQYNNSGAFAGAAGITTDGTDLTIASASRLLWSTDLILRRRAAANLALGAVDAASPVAQTLSVQNVVAGTTNTAGVNFTLDLSQGTGTGAGGAFIIRGAAAGTTGSSQNALAALFTFNPTGSFSITGGTVTASAPLLDLAQTWNAGAVTFSAIKLNVTNTASASASTLLDLQVGGTTQLKVRADGTVFFPMGGGQAINSDAGGGGTGIVFYCNNTAAIECAAHTTGFKVGSGKDYRWSSSANANGTPDTYIGRRAAANIRLGDADAASPVAQTLSAQGVVAGTSNTAGVDWTFDASQGTGTGDGGAFKWRTAPAGSSGSSQNALGQKLKLTAKGSLVVGDNAAALATNATDGFLYIPSCAGTPTGVPTGQTGTVALVYDTTNNKIYVYNGAWKATAALT